MFRRERGAALVEAAIVLPVLLLLTFGIWSTARAWNVHNTIDHAAREAARFGATEEPWDIGSSPGAVRSVANIELAASAIAPSDVQTVCIELVTDGADSCDGAVSNTTGTEQVYVRLRWPNYQLNFLFFTLTVDLESGAVSRHES